MSILGTVRSMGEALGLWKSRAVPIGCSMGKVAFRETKRSARLANLTRSSEPLKQGTQAMLRQLFPDLDVSQIRVRRGCRLPANRFDERGSTYAMTFGHSIYWRDEVLDEDDPVDLVKLIHEVMHVEQTRRLGGEDKFACAYGEGYLQGGGDVPARIEGPTAYHRNPLEAEAYNFESEFRDEHGTVAPELLP
jgi:hypothetical protein